MYTQCPRCRTTFVVTEEQITARGGLVRCGRCRSVFQAEGTLFEALPPASTG
ncbi:MAG: MJ0042-type zinc finger domain-containing protein, partial [Acidiferrobacteraceae bacterium]